MPATLNTTIRGPPASQASRNVPGPEFSRLVTTNTRPPRPPKACRPPPSAPGNAGIVACGRSPGRDASWMKGLPFLAHASISGRARAKASSERRSASALAASACIRMSSEICGYWASTAPAQAPIITPTPAATATRLLLIARITFAPRWWCRPRPPCGGAASHVLPASDRIPAGSGSC